MLLEHDNEPEIKEIDMQQGDFGFGGEGKFIRGNRDNENQACHLVGCL